MALENNRSRPRALHAFVGRERELEELRAGLADAVGGRGRLFLLVGEPGIGKTRLCEEACAEAAAAGALPSWGRCWEGGAPAFWPWLQIFRALAANVAADVLAAAVGDDGPELAAIAPDLVAAAGLALPPAPGRALESEHERFPVFDAVAGFLARVAARVPLVLVLDDLHAADEPSLLLLEFLGRELASARLLVLLTCREEDSARRPEVGQRLSAIARLGHRLPLRGLSRAEVCRLIDEALELAGAEQRADAGELGARLFDATGGNPLFVDELLRVLIAEGGAPSARGLHIPQGIRDTVRERLRPLSAPCREALGLASVLGREFDLALLRKLGLEPLSVLDPLGEAEAAGLVARLDGPLPRYAFGHAVVRDAIYEDLPPARRAQLHWRTVEALEDLGDVEREERIAELAHHALRGAVAGEAEKAVDYAARAGERAAAHLAFEEAAARYQRAIDALALVRAPGDVRRIELLLALGEVQARGWNTPSAQETFRHAAALAQALLAGDAEAAGPLLARAALGFGGTGIGVPRGRAVDATLLALLESALDALGSSDPALRARLLARLAVEIYFSDSSSRRAALCDEAERLARLSGNVSTMAYVVSARHFASWDSPDVDHRLALANEAVGLAQRAGEPDLETVSRLWRLLDLLEKGEVRRWEIELDQLDELARTLRQPRFLSFGATLRAMRALWLGRFDEVDALWERALTIAAKVRDPGASLNVGVQRFALERARGRQADLLPLTIAWAENLPSSPTVRCMRALLHADLGRLDEARLDFDRLAESDFADLQRVNGLAPLFPWLSEICAALGDRQRAAHLARCMQPYARQNLLGGPRLFFGPAARWLGLLAATEERFDDAVAELRFAAAECRALGGRPAAAETDVALAGVLLRRRAAGDHDEALDLLRRGGAAAGDLGRAHLRAAAEDLASAAEREPRRPDAAEARALASGAGGGGDSPASAPEPDGNGGRTSPGARVLPFPNRAGARLADATRARKLEYVLRREGDFWTVSDGDLVLRLKDSKGLRYLAALLRHPEREFHVLDLVADEREPAAARGDGLGTATDRDLHRLGMHASGDVEKGEKLFDARARAAYRRRLDELRDELDEATRFNDTGRATRAREEMDFLARELARAVGLGGRERAAASGAERARLNVTRAVKAVVRRIARGNPNLGRYLETTVRTGAFCIYRPDPRLKVTWKL